MFTPANLVDMPVGAFEGATQKDMAICNMFNRAVRDLSFNSPDPSPMVLKEALDFTFSQFAEDGHNGVMQSLLKGGFRAPRGFMPEGFEAYGYGRSETAERVFGKEITDTARAFGKALVGGIDTAVSFMAPAPAPAMQPAYAPLVYRPPG